MMSGNIWLKYVWRHLWLHKARTLLTVLGIAFGVALVYAVTVSQKTVVNSFSDFVDSLSGQADLQIKKLDAPFSIKLLAKARLKEVTQAAGAIIKNDFLIIKQTNQAVPVVVFGLNKNGHLHSFKLTDGQFPQNNKQILVTRDLAKLYHLQMNSSVYLKGPLSQGQPTKLKIAGFLASTGIGGAFGGRAVVLPLPAAQQLYQYRHQINLISVKIKNNSPLPKVKKKLKTRFPSAFEVAQPVEKGATAQSIVASTKAALQSFAYLALLSGALIVLNTMRVSLAQRTPELALLRTIGASRWQIGQLTFLEASLFGIFGSLLGLVFGSWAAVGLASITAATYQLPTPNLSFSLADASLALLTGLSLTFIASGYPAYRMSRLHPLQALGVFHQQEKVQIHLKQALISIFFVMAGFVFYWLRRKIEPTLAFNLSLLSFILAISFFMTVIIRPFARLLAAVFAFLPLNSFKLAVKSLDLHQKSTAAALTTLVIATILTVGIGELRLSDESLFQRYLKQNFQRDLALGNPIPYSVASANQYPPLPYSLKDKIARIAEVKRVLPFRIVTSKGLGKELYTIVIDPRRENVAKVTFAEGELYQAHRLLLKGGYIFLSTTLSRQHNLHLKDNVKIKTPRGWKMFKIAGIYNELANNGEAVYISYTDLKKYWQEQGVDSFFIDLKPGANINKVRAKLAAKFARPLGLTLTSHQEERNRAARTVDAVLRGFDALVLVTILMAGLSLANLGLVNIFSRQRELGILQALGSFKSQITRLVLAEACLIGLLGGFIGIVAGLPIARLILRLGESLTAWHLNYFFPTKPIIQAVIVSLLVPPVAYLYGAYRATKMSIIEALRYE